MAPRHLFLEKTEGVLCMSTIDIKLGEPKSRVLCKFVFQKSIYDSGLPKMVRERLASGHIHPDSNKIYLIDVSFDIAVYKQKAFYEFPTEHIVRPIGQPGLFRQEKEKRINEVLRWQLKKTCQELSDFGIRYRYATIAGEDFKGTQQVILGIYADIATTEEVIAETDGRKVYNPKVYTILLHRPLIIEKLAEQVANSFCITAEEQSRLR